MCRILSIGMWLGILAISTSSIEAKSTQQDIRKVIKSCHEASVPADCLLLGNSLARSGGVQLAIPAYLKALTIWTRESAPQDWAMVNHNLGTSLIALGYDESDLNTIHMGVDHLKEALKERTSDRTPLKWAATQHALGRAYTRLGELESNSQRFDEAMAFFELALQERTRESYPLKWADTKVGIGRLMSLQAMQLSSQQGTERLEQSPF